MCCNPCSLDIVIPFITEQTKCLSLLHKHRRESLPWEDTAGWWDCIHLRNIVSGFLVTKRPYLIMPSLVRSFPVIARTAHMFPSLIFPYYTEICCYYIELFSHQILSGYKVFSHRDPRTPGYRNMEKRLENNGRRSTTVTGTAEPTGDVLGYAFDGTVGGGCLWLLSWDWQRHID